MFAYYVINLCIEKFFLLSDMLIIKKDYILINNLLLSNI